MLKSTGNIKMVLHIKAFQLLLLSQLPILNKNEISKRILKKNFGFFLTNSFNNINVPECSNPFFFYFKDFSLKGAFQKREENEKKNFDENKKSKIFNFKKKGMKLSLVRYRDFAGIEQIIENIEESIEWPLIHSIFYKKLGISCTKGVLFNGPSGTGKTLLAHAIAGELRLPFFCIDPSSLGISYTGENEKRFQKIFKCAKKHAPSIIFIDEIDTIIPSRENSDKEAEKKILGQLLVCMENTNGPNNDPVIVLAATNRANSLDPALRRPGRFDRELNFKPPDFWERLFVLERFSKKLNLEESIDLKHFAAKTSGFVSGDLSGFISLVGIMAISRIGKKFLKGQFRTKNTNQFNKLIIKKIDFEKALPQIQPSMLRRGFVPSPSIEWKNIGGLNEIRKIMSKYIVEPIKKNSEKFFFKKKGVGILLFGPPGCGKTLIAKAIANESKTNFISIKGPEIFDKFLGESEKEIRSIFKKARMCSPSIIFFDEIDSIATKRTGNGNKYINGANDRVINQLLTEMDGFDFNESVFIIGATNRPNIIDEAILRPGRIDKFIFVPLPCRKERKMILRTILKKLAVVPYIESKLFTEKLCLGFSGSDLNASANEGLVDSKEKKITYCAFFCFPKKLSIKCTLIIGSKNLLNGMEKVKKNMQSN